MNVKEAIRVIESNYPTENYIMLREGLDLALKVLEKHIPYTPTDIARIYTRERVGTCLCGNDAIFEHSKFCDNCGQLLNWNIGGGESCV